MNAIKLYTFYITFLLINFATAPTYQPTWDSLDKRPLPVWYDEAKIGIFLHWGVFSVPSFHSEWFWWDWQGSAPQTSVVQFMKSNYPPQFTYAKFAADFNAQLFNATSWVDIFKASGARYVVLTSKHHEGFTNWPSKYSWNWNAGDIGPKRDLVGQLATAIRNQSRIRFGLYHSMYEWFHPLYLADKAAKFHSQEFVQVKTMPELYEIVRAYKPDVLWSDGDWEASPSYWNSTHFLAWLYNESPVKDSVVTNDRWGSGTLCKHGGYYTCSDRYNPGHLLPRKWENCFSLDRKSWGYRREAKLKDYFSPEEMISQVITSVSCGGNVLINIGPKADGTLDAIFEERLRQLGAWLSINGEAIYNSTPWKYQNDTFTKGVWYTRKSAKNLQTANNNGTIVYAMLLNWPSNGKVFLGSVASKSGRSHFQLIGIKGNLIFNSSTGRGTTVFLPRSPPNHLQWAWTVRISGIDAV